ncbi:MAG TPA: hypothetical protein VJ386_11975 [Candidatus Deferrimicrobiaceae bacterium]|nr:hypothetical protein [Candidatus Deferrimicrobiaceae bacterium]
MPEVYFRIVHAAQVGHNNVPVPTFSEQTVEISVESKGVFKNDPIANVTRRTPVERIVSAISPHRGDPKPPMEPKPPRVTELLKKAIEWQALLDAGKIASQAEIASSEGITCARVSQVMGMLRLAPEIQKRVLTLPVSVRRTSITERLLRPITGITDHRDQIQEFYKLLKQAAVPLRPRTPEGSCRS